MATIVHRRPAPRRAAVPGGWAGIKASLSPVGWLSLMAAVVFFVVGIRPLLDAGVFAAPSWASIAALIVRALGDAAFLAMPAALQIGYPGIARRNRWLLRGAVLLVAADVLRPLLGIVEATVVPALDPASGGQADPTSALGLAFMLATLAIGFVSISGAWTFGDGLADAGARPPRLVVPLIALAAAGSTLAAYWPFLSTSLDLSALITWINLLGLALSLVVIALYGAIGIRLLWGPFRGLVPRRAWVLAAIAGASILVVRVLSPITVAIGGSTELNLAMALVGFVVWPSLALAALLGLGRGTRSRRMRSQLVHLYVLDPTD